MDWKIIHLLGACKLTLKHLRVEVTESCLGGIQSSGNKTGCKYKGDGILGEMLECRAEFCSDKQVFGLHFLKTESHWRPEEQNDGPRAMLHKANLTLTSKLGMDGERWGSDGNLADMNGRNSAEKIRWDGRKKQGLDGTGSEGCYVQSEN